MLQTQSDHNEQLQKLAKITAAHLECDPRDLDHDQPLLDAGLELDARELLCFDLSYHFRMDIPDEFIGPGVSLNDLAAFMFPQTAAKPVAKPTAAPAPGTPRQDRESITQRVPAAAAELLQCPVTSLDLKTSFFELGLDQYRLEQLMERLDPDGELQLAGLYNLADLIDALVRDHTDGAGAAQRDMRARINRELRRIVATETGMEVSDVDPFMGLSEFGMDSLTQVAVVDALNDALELDLDLSFLFNQKCLSDFAEELLRVMTNMGRVPTLGPHTTPNTPAQSQPASTPKPATATDGASAGEQTPALAAEPLQPIAKTADQKTAVTELGLQEDREEQLKDRPEPNYDGPNNPADLIEAQAADATPDAGAGPREMRDHINSELRRIVAAEMDLELEEVDPHTSLSDFGLDSLSQIAIVDALNETFELDMDLSFLFNQQCLADFAEELLTLMTEMGVVAPQEKPPTQSQPTPRQFAPAPKVTTSPAADMTTASTPVAAPVPPTPAAIPATPMPASSPSAPAPIAVIGMACRFPGSTTPDAFWEHLATGDNLVIPMPEERNDGSLDDPGFLGFLEDAHAFDSEFFGISPREAGLLDPQQRLFLEVAWKTVEDAGINPENLKGGRTGVFVGAINSDYYHVLMQRDHGHEALGVTGNLTSSIANRVSWFLDLRGPSEVVDTACSSSLVAVHHACRAIRDGDCDTAIAGGVSLNLNMMKVLAFTRTGAISPSGACHTFDAAADGYARGEGGAAILLKPLDQALADGDPVQAVIRATGVNHGGRTLGFTVPNPAQQADLLHGVYNRAGIDPRSISYIETHGTGTRRGDPAEICGLKEGFRDLYKDRDLDHPHEPFCGLGSVKTNIGHLEAAAGIAGMVKVILAMKSRHLPPNSRLKTVNPDIALEKTPFYLIHEGGPWRPPLDDQGNPWPLRAGVSSFGIGGSYAHLILEEPPAPAVAQPQSGPYVFVLSAKTEARLHQYVADFQAWLKDHQPCPAALAHTLQRGRTAFVFRLSVVYDSLDDLRFKLARYKAGPPGVILDRTTGPGAFNSAQTIQGMAARWAAGEHRFDGPVDASPARLSLPTYPFARQIHEIPASALPEPTGPRPKQTAPPLRILKPSPTPVPVAAKASSPPEPVAATPSPAPVPMTVAAKASPSPAPTAKNTTVLLKSLGPKVAPPRREIPKVTLSALPISTVPTAPVVLAPVQAPPKPPTQTVDSLPRLLQATADILLVSPDKVSAGSTFVDLGLDSILAVELVEKLKREWGVSLQASKIYDYPTPRKLASWLDQHAGKTAPAAVPPPNASQPPTTATAPTPQGAAQKELKTHLIHAVADTLQLEPQQVSVSQPFVSLGLDSILGVELVEKLKRNLGIAIPASRIYDYPNINALSSFLLAEGQVGKFPRRLRR